MVAGARADGIPEHLCVHVGVPVDEPWGNHVPFGIDSLPGPLGDAPDGGDAAALDAHIGGEAGGAGAVHDRAVLDDQVVSHCPPSFKQLACSNRLPYSTRFGLAL